jgi:hypothetical protein
MRKVLLRKAVKNGTPLVVAFPPKTRPARNKPRTIVADCGHQVVMGANQRKLGDKLPTCCVVCAFIARIEVDQIKGMDDIVF